MRVIGIVTLVLIGSVTVTTAPERKPLGEIDFFGCKGLDVRTIRAALPLHEGELFPPAKVKHSDDLKRQVGEAVKQVIGREPTSVSFVCCDAKQNWMVYIGLPGESYAALAFNPTPAGTTRFPKGVVGLRQRWEDAWSTAVIQGHATEDESEGYALAGDPRTRKEQLAMRDYALHNEALVLRVLASSSDARHRAIAAQLLGYGPQSEDQIDALVQASLDADDDVRNDAVRALWVLGDAKPNLAEKIPLEPFIRLLRSGEWSDHNKASLVLVTLTKRRDPRVLAQLRAEALDPLLEMARWRSIGHAEAALLILGRMAGLDEDALNKLIEAGQVDTILGKFDRQIEEAP
jgi:hypothetical protein